MLKTLKRLTKAFLWFLLIILIIGLIIPQNIQMPVTGAGNADFNLDYSLEK